MGFFKVVRVFLYDAGQWLSIRHFQSLCVVIVALVLGSLANTDRPRMDTGHFYGTVHLGCFAACFGAQLWVIFVAGMTMFFILPRHHFGRLQTFMFPMFFLWCLVTSGITLSTFSYRPPRPLPVWDRTHFTLMTCLTLSFLAAAINSIVLAPLIIRAMVATFRYEVEVGAGNLIGHVTLPELIKNPDYVKCYSQFRRCHSASALLNVMSLVSNLVYLHHLGNRLMANEGLG